MIKCDYLIAWKKVLCCWGTVDREKVSVRQHSKEIHPEPSDFIGNLLHWAEIEDIIGILYKNKVFHCPFTALPV